MGATTFLEIDKLFLSRLVIEGRTGLVKIKEAGIKDELMREDFVEAYRYIVGYIDKYGKGPLLKDITLKTDIQLLAECDVPFGYLIHQLFIRYKKSCYTYPNCNAPICPDINMDDCVWFPHEEICRSRRYSLFKWIKKQRKISKKTIYLDRYFAKNDIERIKRVTKKTKGKNPDKDIAQRSIQNYPSFNQKTSSNKGVYDITTTPTCDLLTDNKNSVTPPLRGGIVKS